MPERDETPILPPAIAWELAEGGRNGRARLEARTQRDGGVRYAIFDETGGCLLAPGWWTQDPMPSSERAEAHLAETRHPLAGALDLWRRHLLLACSGGSFRRGVTGNAPPESYARIHDPWGVVALCGPPRGEGRPEDWIVEGRAVPGIDPRFGGTELDCALRGAIALLWDGARGGFPVAAGGILVPGVDAAVRARLDDDARGVADALLPALGRDLTRHVVEVGPMRIGPVTLVLGETPAGPGVTARPAA